MDQQQNSLEQRVADLEGQVASLQEQLTAIEERVASGSERTAQARGGKSSGGLQSKITSEEVLDWLDKSALMPRVASTSFILVLAIALRTLTDSGIVGLQAGSGLGVLYAFILIATGCYSYSRHSLHAPVFTLWGTIIMCSVVVETHRVFDALPPEPAYLILVLTGAATAIVGRQFQVALPVFAGTLGMTIGGFAIDYPNPWPRPNKA